MELEKKWELEIYSAERGREPFVEWLDCIDSKLRTKIYTRLHSVQLGNFGDYKFLGEGVAELKFNNGIRIYYSEIHQTIILLLCGGGKNTKRDQSSDIAKAKGFLVDYKRRAKC